MTIWWFGMVGLDAINVVVPLYRDFFRAGSVIIVNLPTSNTRFVDFLSTEYGVHVGREIVFTFAATPALLRTLSECTPWPWGHVFAMLRLFRGLELLVRFMAPIISPTLVTFLAGYFVASNIMVMSGIHLRERLARKGFVLLHDGILARDFRDRLLIITRVVIANPLTQLIDTHHEFLLMIGEKCVSTRSIPFLPNTNMSKLGNIRSTKAKKKSNSSFFSFDQRYLISRPFLDNLPALSRNALILQELALGLKVTDPLFWTRRQHIPEMKAQFVYDLAQRVACWFESSSSDFSLQVSLRVSPSLTMIRVDENLFCAVLCSLCRRARERVQEQAQNSCEFRGQSHELIIWIKAIDDDSYQGNTDSMWSRSSSRLFTELSFRNPTMTSQDKEFDQEFAGASVLPRQRFTDVRTMIITVLDTAPSVNSNQSLPITLQDLLTTQLVAQQGRQSRYRRSRDMQMNISDSYCAYFNLPSRSREGAVLHSRCQTFQQVALPFLLCPDTHKVCSWRDDESFTLSRISWRRESAERSYSCGFAGALDELLDNNLQSYSKSSSRVHNNNQHLIDRLEHHADDNTSMTPQKAFKMALRSTLLLVRELHIYRSRGQVGIFTHLNIALAQRSAYNRDLFITQHWNSCTLFNLRSWPSDSLLAELDCIIIDMEMILPIRELIISSHGGDNLGDMRYVTKEFDAIDILNYIRCRHFQGSVVFAKTPLPAPNYIKESGSRTRNAGRRGAEIDKPIRKPVLYNPYAHASKADLEVDFPLDIVSVQKISDICEIKLVKTLIHIDDM
jgi:hypothetical protein